jgi:hypothetical protein
MIKNIAERSVLCMLTGTLRALSLLCAREKKVSRKAQGIHVDQIGKPDRKAQRNTIGYGSSCPPAPAHSVLKLFTGLVNAALKIALAITAQVMHKTPNMGSTNIQGARFT